MENNQSILSGIAPAELVELFRLMIQDELKRFKDNLPEIILNRPKMGFAFPFKEWFSNPKYSRAQTGKDFSEMHTRLKSNQLHWSQFFTLLMLEEYPHAH